MPASSQHHPQQQEDSATSATSASLSFPFQSAKTSRGQLRHSWPQTTPSSAASFATTPSSTFATAATTASASSPNLSGSSSSTSSSSNRKGTLAALCPRKIQFAGDVLEDWLFADSILNLDLPTVPLNRSLIAAALDSLPDSAPQTRSAEKRHIRSAGSNSEVLSAFPLLAVHRPTKSAPSSTKAPHTIFLPLPASNNAARAQKLHTRSVSPTPTAARSRPTLDSAKPLPASLPSTASDLDLDLEEANLLLTRHMRIASPSRRPASNTFACRLQRFRQQIQKRRFRNLSARPSSSTPAVHAHNTRAVKSWVSEQRGIGARIDEAWMAADL